MGIRISDHARKRASERGLPPYMLSKMARNLARCPDGEYEVGACVVVLRRGTITTVLEQGMRRDARM